MSSARPPGKEVQGGKLLEDPDGVVGGEDHHGAGEADPPGAGGDGGEDHRRGRDHVLLPVVLPHGVDPKPHLFRQLRLLQKAPKPLLGRGGAAEVGVQGALAEGVEPELHGLRVGQGFIS